MSSEMQIPEDLLQALNHCDSAIAKETGWRIAALRSMIAQEYNHDAHHKPYSALVMAHEHITRLEAQNAKLQAQVERLSAPVSEQECYAFQCNYGDSTLSRYWIERAVDALIASRKA